MAPPVSDNGSGSQHLSANEAETPVQTISSVTKPNKLPPKPPRIPPSHPPPPLPPRNQQQLFNGLCHVPHIAHQFRANSRCVHQQVLSVSDCSCRQNACHTKIYQADRVPNCSLNMPCNQQVSIIGNHQFDCRRNTSASMSLSDRTSCVYSLESKCPSTRAFSTGGHSSEYASCNVYCSSSDNGLEILNQPQCIVNNSGGIECDCYDEVAIKANHYADNRSVTSARSDFSIPHNIIIQKPHHVCTKNQSLSSMTSVQQVCPSNTLINNCTTQNLVNISTASSNDQTISNLSRCNSNFNQAGGCLHRDPSCQSTIHTHSLIEHGNCRIAPDMMEIRHPTIHSHNLSNSSTTTHASNAIAQQQLPPRHDMRFQDRCQTNVSSLTSNLSNFNLNGGLDADNQKNILSNKINQALPPAPLMHHHRPTRELPPIPASNQVEMHQNQMPLHCTQNVVTPNIIKASNNLAQMTPVIKPSSSPLMSRAATQIQIRNQLPTMLDLPPPLPPLPVNRYQNVDLIGNNVDQSAMFQSMSGAVDNQIHSYRKPIQIADLENGRVTISNPAPNLSALRGNDTFLIDRKLCDESTRGTTQQVYGTCASCKMDVLSPQTACRAQNQIYHANCFTCSECKKTLRGKTFYEFDGKVYCEEDYKYSGSVQAVERCASCKQPITNMVIQAIGKSYHPFCFKCCVCNLCLDGISFTIDQDNKIYCIDDYHSKYSPKCALCEKAITPIEGSTDTVCVVSMGKDYHIDCFCCQDCGVQLTDEESNRSYPLDDRLLCEGCHIRRLSASRKSSLKIN